MSQPSVLLRWMVVCATWSWSLALAQDASDPLARVREAATVEPTGVPAGLPLPPGVTQSIAPLREPAEGWRRLDELLPALAEALEEPRAPARPRDPESVLDAQRLYAAGRLRHLDGDSAGAIRDLSSAATLVPDEAPVWRALAEAQAAEGLRTASLDSLRRAVRFGLRDPAMLFAVAEDRARLGQHEPAAHMLAAALREPDPREDPALEPVLYGALAESLRALGHELAANEAVERALDLPDRLDEPTAMRLELAALLRRAPQLRREAGDSMFRLSRPADALRVYRLGVDERFEAVVWPEADLPRVVYAAAASGRPSSALLAVLAPVADGRAALDPTRRELLVYLAEHAGQRDAIVSALGEMAGPEHAAPTRAARLTLASAAVAGAAHAREVLTSALRDDPERGELIDALLALGVDPSDKLALAGALAEAQPDRADLYAGRLLASVARDPAVLDVPARSASESLVLVYAAVGLAQPQAAELRLRELDATAPGVRLARVFVGVELGQWDEVNEDLAAMTPGTLATARALRAAQRLHEAADAAQALIEAGDRLISVRLGLAELLDESGEPDAAAELLRSTIEQDPADPRAYEALLTLHSPEGPLASAAEQRALLEAMRAQCPGAMSLRMLSAQALAEQGLLAEAEARLVELVDDPDASPAALSALTRVWRARVRSEPGTMERALEWLEARLAERPFDEPTMGALATVLVDLGRPADAAARLDERLARSPAPALARLREEITRSALGDAAAADAMALDRLTAAPPSIGASIELAQSLARAGDPAARDALRRAMPVGAVLTRSQSKAVLDTVRAALRRAAGARDAARAAHALAMLDDAVGFGLEPGWDAWHDAFHALAVDEAAEPGRLVQLLRRMLGAVGTAELARGVLSIYSEEPADAGATLDQLRAEIAYRFASGLYAQGHEDASLSAYRLVLEHDPEHAWSNNDLGYFLVERGDALDEAERLLERAYQARPEEASIIDSLGWLRYRLGVLHDEPRRAGAVTLLSKAASLEGGRANATILDHLGDALYRARDSGGAVNAWRRARAAADRELARLPAGVPAPVRARAEAEQAGIVAKLDAMEVGAEPPVAPMLERGG